MEQQKNLTTTNNLSIAIIPQQTLCKTLFEINQLVAFPLADSQLEDWSANIKRLSPNTTTDELRLVLDKFITGRTKWDKNEGIQNIFRGINLLKINKGEYLDEIAGMKYRNFGEIPNQRRIYENDREF